MSDIISLGLWIKRRRKALDLTQDELAQRVGCSLAMIQKIEGDARRPSREIAARLADQLQLTDGERGIFVQAARAELGANRLAPPTQTIARGALIRPSNAIAEPRQASELPRGTITFLLTDIEGSSRLWEQHPQLMASVLARHDTLLKESVIAHAGVVFKTVGDSVMAAFAEAPNALAAALAAQRALGTERWALPQALRVRMALHTGSAKARDGDYFGPALNRAARLLQAGHGGQVLLSLATEELVREHLPADATLSDLDIHRLKDLSLPEQIFQLVVPDLPQSFPPLNTLDARHTNMPAQPTALIGREAEVASLTALLRAPDVRLVTLTGPGGVGKTRLSVQIGAELVDEFTDGVYFVDLAPIRDPRLVSTAVAAVLNVRESGGQSLLDRLKHYLRDKHVLLLLDNFEQVLPASLLIAELLAAAAQLKILLTSREILRLRGEKVIDVPPLSVPSSANLPSFDHLSQYAAVELFIQRARDVQPNFEVTNTTAPAVAEVCARLDGLPLAIELAAARSRLFPPEALLARLSSRLTLLTSGPRDLPARQQTLRGTVAWSYDLLTTDEQRLFRWLGVFVGSCSVEAAEAVYLAPGEIEIGVLGTLGVLVDRSLLRQTPGEHGEPRFSMLETIREYALERLEASGEAELSRQRHAAYYLVLAKAAETNYSGTAQQAARLARLEAEHDNLRAALEWSLSGGDEAGGAQLAAALGEFWLVRGHDNEGHTWLASALASRGIPLAGRARLLNHAGALAAERSVARQMLEQSLALFRELGNTEDVGQVLYRLGEQALGEGDTARASALFEEGLALAREVGSEQGIGWHLFAKGRLARHLCDYTGAQRLCQEALLLFERLGNRWAQAWVYWALGHLARSEGDDIRAATYYDHCLTIAQEFGDQSLVASMYHNLAYVALHQGEVARAKHLLVESLVISRTLGQLDQAAWALAGLGGVAVAEGRPERAARLLSAAVARFEATVHVIDPTERDEHNRAIAEAQAQLDEAIFARAWAAGRAMTLEQAMSYALNEEA